MKVIHGSLKNLLQEVKDKKVDAVRVAGFMLSGRRAPRRGPWQAKVDEEVPRREDPWRARTSMDLVTGSRV